MNKYSFLNRYGIERYVIIIWKIIIPSSKIIRRFQLQDQNHESSSKKTEKFFPILCLSLIPIVILYQTYIYFFYFSIIKSYKKCQRPTKEMNYQVYKKQDPIQTKYQEINSSPNKQTIVFTKDHIFKEIL